jgi:uncharacterized protein (TIGR00297 family)
VTQHSEETRQWVHIGSGGFAFLLRTLTWQQGAAFAVTALAFNLLVLPRAGGRRLYRPVDVARGFPLGIVLYPLAVLALILLFPARLDIAAAAWGILAFGDGAATLAGRGARRTWPWSRDKTNNSIKSIRGTIAFIVCGGAGAIALASWTRPAVSPEPPLWFALLAPLAAAVVAGFVETIPVRLDDNVSVPASAAAILWIASLITPGALAGSRAAVVAALPYAVGINALAAWLGHRAGTVSMSGAIVGGLIGFAMYAAGGPGAWLLLFVTFATAAISSRMGLKRKVMLGIAEERGGRRRAANALANCSVAVIAATAASATPYSTAARLAMVAALTAAGSDTVASEIGKAWGRHTFLVTGFKRVRAGTPGAMSLEGTAAGLLAALGLAALAAGLGEITWSMIAVVVAGSVLGAGVESVFSATLEGPGILNNDTLNFINTAVAAAVAVALA